MGQLLNELQGPMNQRTEQGMAASLLLGSPVAAYSAVTAGGALGTKAVMDLYRYLQEDQQAQKEGQLPLTGKRSGV
ncbi:hypothetical protein [Synechococcus sp. 1G10]|uniref:hypothetical protein n=1 Tax=Synechococcus sp. 1G10 TaxID=2025605 RepID=UPI00117DDB34|nr:hypothetical protein [Synechococcus sp. 1G10]